MFFRLNASSSIFFCFPLSGFVSEFLLQMGCQFNGKIIFLCTTQGRIQDFKLGGAHLKKIRRAEGGAKIFGVFRWKNHDFTPKSHIFSNCEERRENVWGISFEKSRFYTNIFFSNFRGGARRVRPPLDPPLLWQYINLCTFFCYININI